MASLSRLNLDDKDREQLEEKINLDLYKKLTLDLLEPSDHSIIARRGTRELKPEDNKYSQKQYLVYYHLDS